jgi:hypothetical protein
VKKGYEEQVSKTRAGENVPVFVALAHVSFVMQEQPAHFHLPVSNGAP